MEENKKDNMSRDEIAIFLLKEYVSKNGFDKIDEAVIKNANKTVKDNMKRIAEMCYGIADAMRKARLKAFL